jgi:hypothetical protein
MENIKYIKMENYESKLLWQICLLIIPKYSNKSNDVCLNLLFVQ